jgi:hypothetical protein
MTKTTLKSANLKYIGAVATVDAGICMALASTAHVDFASITSAAALRLLAGPVVAVISILVSSILPADFKAILVYWRIRDALPGCRAYSVHARRDPRINIDALTKNVGALPTDPREQNTKWYKLLKKVDDHNEVRDAHGRFLLFRDLTGLSLLMAILASAALAVLGYSAPVAALAFGIFVCQFVVSAVAGRFSGNRLVANVLALHSVKKYK